MGDVFLLVLTICALAFSQTFNAPATDSANQTPSEVPAQPTIATNRAEKSAPATSKLMTPASETLGNVKQRLGVSCR
jgi:hypothetical protein